MKSSPLQKMTAEQKKIKDEKSLIIHFSQCLSLADNKAYSKIIERLASAIQIANRLADLEYDE